MAEQLTSHPTSGWYADPRVPRQVRWWDGQDWTNNVHMPDSGVTRTADADLLPGIAEQHDGKWEFPQV